MFGLSFKRVRGAVADVKELEYVAALSQTCTPETRENGTIGSLDVARLLSSRYGLFISRQKAVEIVRHLSGETGYSKDELLTLERERKKKEKATGGRLPTSWDRIKDDEGDIDVEKSLSGLVGKPVGKFGHRRDKEEPGASDSAVPAERSRIAVGEDSSGGGGDDGVDGGTDTEVPEEYLDILQVASILVIPALTRASKDFRVHRRAASCPNRKHDDGRSMTEHAKEEPLDPQPPTLIQDSLKMILKDVSVLATPEDGSGGTEDGHDGDLPPVVRMEFIKAILLEMGEYDRAEDHQLMEEMAGIATSSSGRLDEEALINAITYDLGDWKIASEDRVSTFFYDVFGHDQGTTQPPPSSSSAVNQSNMHSVKPDITTEYRNSSEKVIGASVGNSNSNDIGGDCDTKDEEDPMGTNHVDSKIPLPDDGGGKEIDAANKGNGNSNSTGGDYDFKAHYRDHSSYDFVIDSHSSVFLVVVTWLFYLLLTITYSSLLQTVVEVGCPDPDSFACQLSETLITWLAMAVLLTVFGVAIIVPLSIGNNPNARTPGRAIIAIVLTVAYCIVPYALVNDYKINAEDPYTSSEEMMNAEFFDESQEAALVAGTLVIGVTVWFFILTFFPRHISSYPRWLQKIVITSNTNGEFQHKRAATRKINLMLMNAQSLHAVNKQNSELESSSKITMSKPGASMRKKEADQTMLNYVQWGQHKEIAGGFIWTLKLLLNGKYFDSEGIWIPTRMLVFQFAQAALSCLFGYVFYALVPVIIKEVSKAQESIEGQNDLPDWVMTIIPTEKDVKIALYPAASVAVIVMVLLTLLNIPSATTTILKYRCGVLPSLGSPHFVKYRLAVDTAHMNTGNAIYGLFGAGVLFYFIVGLLIFLFMWDFSRAFMLQILSWFLGLMICILVKFSFTRTCRRYHQKAFYRSRPRVSNVITLMLECWHIGLGGSVLIGRIVQFLLAAVFWVGRIDVPYLAENVRVGGYFFDNVPTHFVKDLLVHEAHRHPYVERLSQMYLMKLNFPSFASHRAAAAWRQVLVAAIMPWLRKFRVFQEERLIQSLQSARNHLKEVKEDSKALPERLGDDMKAVEDAAESAGVAVVEGMKTGAWTRFSI